MFAPARLSVGGNLPPLPLPPPASAATECKNGLVVEDKAGCYLTCVFDVCSLSEMAGIEITAGEKLHCREKSSHVGNKTRQTGTKLASSDPNPPARMDWLSRIRRGVYGALPYLCV